MKQHNYNKIVEEKNILETDITSAFRSIDVSYKNTNMWYQSRRPLLHSKKSKSYFTIPLFGTTFAAICACIMIFSTNYSQNSPLAVKKTTENASFAMNTGDATPSTVRTMKTTSNEQPEERILSKIDQSILTSSRVQTDTFTSTETEDTLNTLFE